MLKVLRQAPSPLETTLDSFSFFWVFSVFAAFARRKTMERDERKMHVAGFRFRSIAFHCTAKFLPFPELLRPFLLSSPAPSAVVVLGQKIGETVYGSPKTFWPQMAVSQVDRRSQV